MVVTRRPSTAAIGTMQLLAGMPSICMVHAPHAPMPQPNLLPVRPSCSRTTHSNGTSGGPSNCAGCWLTENVTGIVGSTSSAPPLIGRSCNRSLLARLRGDAGANRAYRLRQITPGRLIRKCPAHIAREIRKLRIGERAGEIRHDGAGWIIERMDAGENRMNQVEGIGRGHRALQGQVASGMLRWVGAPRLVALRAGCGVDDLAEVANTAVGAAAVVL